MIVYIIIEIKRSYWFWEIQHQTHIANENATKRQKNVCSPAFLSSSSSSSSSSSRFVFPKDNNNARQKDIVVIWKWQDSKMTMMMMMMILPREVATPARRCVRPWTTTMLFLLLLGRTSDFCSLSSRRCPWRRPRDVLISRLLRDDERGVLFFKGKNSKFFSLLLFRVFVWYRVYMI